MSLPNASVQADREPPPADALASRLHAMIEMCDLAGSHTLDLFRSQSLRVDAKPDGTPVTDADRLAEDLLRRAVLSRFPHDEILGEEFGLTPGSSGFRWIFDPIDGTKSFVRGVPLYGVLAAVQYHLCSVAGMILMPALEEAVWASHNHGATHAVGKGPSTRRNTPARVSSTRALKDALLCSTGVDGFQATNSFERFNQLCTRIGAHRGWSDCYGHLLVATGRADAVLEPVLSLWDFAPFPVIMHEAGGRYSDWAGREDNASTHGISTNGLIHDELLAHFA